MERDWFAVGWKTLVVRGVIGMVFGILAIVWPLETATALALLWSFWALLDGIWPRGGLAARRELNRSEISSVSPGSQ
jgi:uncharacterized membrane protein HdeD (DUF308 family)